MGICALVGAYVIAKKVIVPIVEAVDDGLKITETISYGMTKIMNKLNNKNKQDKKD